MKDRRNPSRREAKAPKPLTAASLDWFALRYVERYATTEARLADYLRRKLRERGWDGEGEAPVSAVVARLASLGYVNDRLFGESKARGMERRGLGPRRVTQALAAAGLATELRSEIGGDVDAVAAAVAFALRKRLGPFGDADISPDMRRRQFAAFVRAGHSFDLAKAVMAARSEADLDGLSAD